MIEAMRLWHEERGFTLLELIVVSGFLLVALIITAIVLHPRDYGGQQRDGQRMVDMAQIATAVSRYQQAHSSLPPGITTSAQMIGNEQGDLDLCKSLAPTYLKDLPIDSTQGGKISNSAQDITNKPCSDSDVS